MMSISNPMR